MSFRIRFGEGLAPLDSNRSIVRILTLAGIWLVANQSSAMVIEYDLDSLGGDVYQYTYNVINDDVAAGVEEFSILFDLGLYSNLLVTASPSGWDSVVFQPDPLLPDDGIFDSLNLNGMLAQGESIDGFSVSFSWLGQDLPASQLFDIVDPSTFETLVSGTTKVRQAGGGDPTPVPEPPLILLFLMGLLGIAVSHRRALF